MHRVIRSPNTLQPERLRKGGGLGVPEANVLRKADDGAVGQCKRKRPGLRDEEEDEQKGNRAESYSERS